MKRYFAIKILFWLLITSHSFAHVVDIPDPSLREAIREELQLPTKTPITQQDMTKLKNLDIHQREIAYLTGLEFADNLEFLSAWGNPISELTPLLTLTQLKYLDLAGCDIADVEPLSNLTSLENLNLGWNILIQDPTPLSNLTQLKSLALQYNSIADISPLASLTQLKKLWIYGNQITDFSPLDGLSLEHFEYDKNCELPALPIEQRIKNRTFPSIFAAWGGLGYSPVENLPELTDTEHIALHDLHWSCLRFELRFVETYEGWQTRGPLERAQARRDSLLALNPNMLFLAEVRMRDSSIGGYYPQDFPYWLKDINGNRVPISPGSKTFIFDFTQPGMQDMVVQHAVAVAKCGLYDGIFFDWFAEAGHLVLNGYYSYEEEQRAKDNILQRIRASVSGDFLIIINTGRFEIPRRAWGINGTFLETIQDTRRGLPVIDGDPYGYEGLKQIENTLLWAEENLREPQINCLEGWGLPTEPPDSPTNLRFMRLFTTMSLTHSDGYVLYGMENSHQHIWYDFWNADLGRPVGAKAQRYRDIEGIYIREFTNGWAVYNRSGKTQAITLPRVSTGVSSNKQDITHLLPDLDGEIYLRKGKPYDLNRDGTVNVLDLIIVSQGFNTTQGDINGDGTTDILDLTLVAQQLTH